MKKKPPLWGSGTQKNKLFSVILAANSLKTDNLVKQNSRFGTIFFLLPRPNDFHKSFFFNSLQLWTG